MAATWLQVKECEENHKTLENTLTEFTQNEEHAETECGETASTGEESFVASVGTFCDKAKVRMSRATPSKSDVKNNVL